MATILLLRQKFINKLVVPARTQWRLAQKSVGTIDSETLIQEAAAHSRLSESELSSALSALCDTAALFLSIGHGVQLGNLGTLSLSISSKAVDSEEECTAETIRGKVGVNLRAIGRLAKAINEFKYRVAGVSSEPADSDGGEPNASTDPENPNDSNEPAPSVDRTDPSAGQYSLVYRDAEGETLVTHHYNEGETIVPIEAPEGYRWPDSLPTVMPADNVRVQCVAV